MMSKIGKFHNVKLSKMMDSIFITIERIELMIYRNLTEFLEIPTNYNEDQITNSEFLTFSYSQDSRTRVISRRYQKLGS